MSPRSVFLTKEAASRNNLTTNNHMKKARLWERSVVKMHYFIFFMDCDPEYSQRAPGHG